MGTQVFDTIKPWTCAFKRRGVRAVSKHEPGMGGVVNLVRRKAVFRSADKRNAG